MPTRTLSFRPQEPELILETSGAPIVPKWKEKKMVEKKRKKNNKKDKKMETRHVYDSSEKLCALRYYSSSPRPGMGREFTILTHAENTNTSRATDSRTAVTLFPNGEKMGGPRLHNRETRTTLKKEGGGGRSRRNNRCITQIANRENFFPSKGFIISAGFTGNGHIYVYRYIYTWEMWRRNGTVERNKMMEGRKFSMKDLPSPTPFEVRAQPFRGRLPTLRGIDTLASCEHDTPSHSVDFVLEKYVRKTVKIWKAYIYIYVS